MTMRTAFAGLLAAVLSLVPGAEMAAQRAAISIELAHDSPDERAAKEQLERLLTQYDLSRWVFTKRILIEQGVRPHSHPVLTLNTRGLGNDGRALAGFVHEQIHWFLTGRSRDTSRALAAVRKLFPDVPESLLGGGAGSRDSTYLHLIVCELEFESLRVLLGSDVAFALLREEIAFGQTGRGYHWIYQTVLDDQLKLSALIRESGLALPGAP
jgi:hypothetical protein